MNGRPFISPLRVPLMTTRPTAFFPFSERQPAEIRPTNIEVACLVKAGLGVGVLTACVEVRFTWIVADVLVFYDIRVVVRHKLDAQGKIFVGQPQLAIVFHNFYSPIICKSFNSSTSLSSIHLMCKLFNYSGFPSFTPER
ncbi:hypothetical protein AVEN_270170-1 [Araneus ventricosus]|uniref:Uncharacterized protein n=1 Tax=Araneus ventricosus TaxID=182803 RepID=A0A4Y2JNB9_ARAVE|nr:hypothetical protein AVEN_270170-1 [Araneus ventricosus]